MFTFEVGIYADYIEKKLKMKPDHTTMSVAESVGKAKYAYWREYQDVWNRPFGEFLPWVYCKKTGVAAIHHLFGDREQFERVRESRRIPLAELGMKVEVAGRSGRIVGGNHSANLDIVFDGEWTKSNCHPHWEMVYYGSAGEILYDFRIGGKKDEQ
jgi:hypothetical protein